MNTFHKLYLPSFFKNLLQKFNIFRGRCEILASAWVASGLPCSYGIKKRHFPQGASPLSLLYKSQKRLTIMMPPSISQQPHIYRNIFKGITKRIVNNII